ncbi:MAG: ATP-grasp domain-containing protein [Nitrospinae bacterium]|nr:ATP-grasp domain-containing protein [Nitrospinota bacterium]
MKDVRILFLAPHWRVALVRAFAESSLRVVADSDPHSAASRIAERAHVIPRFTEEGCVEAILDVCHKENIDAILPLTNKAIHFMDANRDRFDQAQWLFYLPDPETIKTCTDKRRLADFFKAEGIASPGLVNPGEPFPGFPLIAKDPCGEGGKNCFKMDSQADLDFYSKKYPGHIFQQFIEGREFSIDWFADRHGAPLVIVPRERLVVRSGEVMVSRIDLNPDIIEAARKTGTRLNLRGPANLQGILNEAGEFLFTDVNLRFGSGAVHTIQAGADIPGMMIRELAGESVEGVSSSVKNGSLMTRFHDALFSS